MRRLRKRKLMSGIHHMLLGAAGGHNAWFSVESATWSPTPGTDQYTDGNITLYTDTTGITYTNGFTAAPVGIGSVTGNAGGHASTYSPRFSYVGVSQATISMSMVGYSANIVQHSLLLGTPSTTVPSPDFQYGYVTNINQTPTSYDQTYQTNFTTYVTEVPITFPRAFASAPKVIVGLRTNETDHTSLLGAQVKNGTVTKTGCTLALIGLSNTATDIDIAWFAVDNTATFSGPKPTLAYGKENIGATGSTATDITQTNTTWIPGSTVRGSRHAIPFNTEFASPPSFILTNFGVLNLSGHNSLLSVRESYASGYTPTTTGFTVNVSEIASSGGVYVSWLAIQ